MSNEFKIRVGVDLDDSEARAKLNDLQNLGENNKIELKIDLGKLKGDIESISKSFKNAFKLDTSALNDINKLNSALKEMNKAGSSSALKSTTSSMVNEYKTLANTVEKLQKQMNKGSMGEDSIKRTVSQISELKSKMDSLYSSMDSNAKKQIDLFNTKQSVKGLADMNQSMTKIETSATSLSTKLNSINFNHIDTDKIEKLKSELKEIQDVAKQDINLDLNVGDILGDLNRLSSEIKNLEKVENLASSFDRVKSSANGVGVEIQDISSEIKSLEGLAGNLDGSFDRAFNGLKSQVKDINTQVNQASKSLGKGSGLLGTWDDFKGNFAQFTMAEVAGDFIADGIRTMVRGLKDTIVETDSAMTDLMKVAPESFSGTGEQLKTYLNQVTEVAKGTGQSSVDVINGTAKALQSGFKNMNDALKYSKESAIFANIGDMDQGQADTILASVMSAYGGISNSLEQTSNNAKTAGKSYSRLTDFIDAANYAGNNFAISTSDVGIALQQSASALSANGVSMEKQIGMV